MIDSAKKDLQALLGETESNSSFRFLFADSNSTGEDALKAVKSLVAKGAQIIVGLPTSGEVEAVLTYVNQEKVPVISSASTASHLSTPDNVFRISTPENYRAEIGAELAIKLGCKKAFVIYRDDGWGRAYAETVMDAFHNSGLAASGVSFTPSHPEYMNYSKDVRKLEELVAGGGNETLIYIVAWENEDYSIMNESRKSPALLRCRWLSAALFPSLLDESTVDGKLVGLRDFAITVGLLAPEQYPPASNLSIRLMEEAKLRLGHYPSYEHVYLYDAIMIAAEVLLAAGNRGRDAVIQAIPAVAEHYYGATGYKALDCNGDLKAEDTAFIGVTEKGETYTFSYYVFYDALRDEFNILDKPTERKWFFSPQA
jgi:branched-chain amino acid transport system substrate-binding protein